MADFALTLSDVTGYAHWGSSPAPMLDGDRSLLIGRAVVDGHFFDGGGQSPDRECEER